MISETVTHDASATWHIVSDVSSGDAKGLCENEPQNIEQEPQKAEVKTTAKSQGDAVRAFTS